MNYAPTAFISQCRVIKWKKFSKRDIRYYDVYSVFDGGFCMEIEVSDKNTVLTPSITDSHAHLHEMDHDSKCDGIFWI